MPAPAGLRGRARPPRAPQAAGARAAAKGQAPAAPLQLERHPAIDFHEQVREGETWPLTVRLSDLPAAGTGKALAIGLGAGEESVEIDVRLHAPGFDVKPSPVASVTVRRERVPGTEEVVFRLKARSPGQAPLRREITAEFWLRNASIGAVTHYTFVIPKGHQGPAPGDGSSRGEAFAIPPVRREDCDVIVMVQGRDQAGEAPFRVTLRSEIPGHEVAALDCGLLNLPQKDLSGYIASALDRLIGQYPDSKTISDEEFPTELARWNGDFLARLGDLGKKLWTFLPQLFRSEYFRLYQAGVPPRSILVHSDEMLFPWELVVPHEVVAGRLVELAPLGVAHVLGRWKPQLRMKPSPQRIRVESFVVLSPSYPPPDDLPWSAAEVEALSTLFPGLEVYSPATASQVRQELLQRSDVRLLHFSGHGVFDPTNADLSELLLEGGGALDAMALTGTKLAVEASPIVYLNACSVGSAGVTVGRAGGFAASCLDGGCSGVIAPYWAVNDERAAEFSVALYGKLRAGQAIGEALRELREEQQRDPTFLAFAYFGDPWARASFEALEA